MLHYYGVEFPKSHGLKVCRFFSDQTSLLLVILVKGSEGGSLYGNLDPDIICTWGNERFYNYYISIQTRDSSDYNKRYSTPICEEHHPVNKMGETRCGLTPETKSYLYNIPHTKGTWINFQEVSINLVQVVSLNNSNDSEWGTPYVS